MIREIQYLRAFAALLVVFYHLQPQLKRLGSGAGEIYGLAGGVDIFFCISGFIMTLISIDRALAPIDFLKDRIARVVPVYWLITLFMIAVGLLVPSALQSSVLDFRHVAASMTFIPWAHPVNGQLFPLLQPGWTLNYEMYFYLLFSLFLFMGGMKRYVLLVITLCALTAGIALAEPSGVLRFYGEDVIYEFCLGVILGVIYVHRRDLLEGIATPIIIWGLLIIGTVAMLVIYQYGLTHSRFLAFGLPGMAIVASGLIASTTAAWPQWRIAASIGDASYSLYLTHYVMLSLLGQVAQWLFGKSAPAVALIGFTLVAPLICVAVALVFYRLIERPLHRAVRSLIMPQRKTVGVAAKSGEAVS